MERGLGHSHGGRHLPERARSGPHVSERISENGVLTSRGVDSNCERSISGRGVGPWNHNEAGGKRRFDEFQAHEMKRRMQHSGRFRAHSTLKNSGSQIHKGFLTRLRMETARRLLRGPVSIGSLPRPCAAPCVAPDRIPQHPARAARTALFDGRHSTSTHQTQRGPHLRPGTALCAAKCTQPLQRSIPSLSCRVGLSPIFTILKPLSTQVEVVLSAQGIRPVRFSCSQHAFDTTFRPHGLKCPLCSYYCARLLDLISTSCWVSPR